MTTVLLIVLLPLAGFVLGYVVRRSGRSPLIAREGFELMNRGRSSAAVSKFKELFEKSGTPVAQYNMGLSKLALWQLEEAVSDLEAAYKFGTAYDTIRRGAPPFLGLASALIGTPELANTWLARVAAEDRDLGEVLLAHAALSCRAGDFVKARELLNRHEVKQLGAFNAALANTLNAWCVEKTQAELRHVDRIALFGETGPERLKLAWPELAAFVERAPAA